MRTLVAFFLASILCVSFVSTELVRLPMGKQRHAQETKSLRGYSNFYSQAGGVPIKNWLDMNYICPIKLGSSNETFNVVVDTGSSILWVPHVGISQNVRNKYDCKSSKGCVSREAEGDKNLYYGKGSMRGFRIEDSLNLGDLIIPNFPLLLARDVQDMPLNNFDGIIGLSLDSMDKGYPSVIDRMMEKKLVNSSTFSIYMGNDTSANGRMTGEIIFGGYDPKYALSEFQFVSVKSDSIYWESDASHIGFGNNTNITGNSVSVIFDTGASFLVVPTSFLANTVQKIREAGVSCSLYQLGMYSCDCSAMTKLPDIIVYFGKTAFNIPAKSYFVKDFGNCVLAMMTMQTGPKLSQKIILGDVFLKNYYALYTASNYTVGFAKALPTEPLPFSWTGPIVIVVILLIIGLCVYSNWKGKFAKSSSQSYQAFKGQGVSIGGSRATSYPQQQRFAAGNYKPPSDHLTIQSTPTPVL